MKTYVHTSATQIHFLHNFEVFMANGVRAIDTLEKAGCHVLT